MKNKKWFGIITLVSLILFVSTCYAANSHGKKRQKKIGILLVTFGSSKASAQVSFDNIDKKIKTLYTNTEVRWAYTSHIIRKKLAKQGKHLDSPEVALAKMMDEKFTHVAVQSLHTMLGFEYEDLKNTIRAYKTMEGFEKIILGNPLMATQKDMTDIVDAIFQIIPKERKKDEAVVLMGHGSHHPANAFYAALMFQLQLKDPTLFIGTVEGFPEIDLIQELLHKNNIKKAYLMPFMSVAGDHAKNDMAGDDDDSWKSILTKAGIVCVPVLKGMAEFEPIVNIWAGHLEGSMAQFK